MVTPLCWKSRLKTWTGLGRLSLLDIASTIFTLPNGRSAAANYL